MFIWGIGVMVLVVVAFLPFPGGEIQMFIDLPSFMFIFLSLVSVVVSTSGFKSLVAGFNAVFSKHYQLDDEQKQNSIQLFTLLSKASIISGLIFTVFGIISVLFSFNDPSSIGPLVAASLLSLIYGFGIAAFVFQPICYILKHRKFIPLIRKRSDKEVIQQLINLCIENGISVDEVFNNDDEVSKHDDSDAPLHN